MNIYGDAATEDMRGANSKVVQEPSPAERRGPCPRSARRDAQTLRGRRRALQLPMSRVGDFQCGRLRDGPGSKACCEQATSVAGPGHAREIPTT